MASGGKNRCASAAGAPMHACASLLDGCHMDLAGRGISKSPVRATVALEEDCDGNK
jgi:hypothetical protein